MMVINSCYDLSCPHFKTNYTWTCGDEGVGRNTRNSAISKFSSDIIWEQPTANLCDVRIKRT